MLYGEQARRISFGLFFLKSIPDDQVEEQDLQSKFNDFFVRDMLLSVSTLWDVKYESNYPIRKEATKLEEFYELYKLHEKHCPHHHEKPGGPTMDLLPLYGARESLRVVNLPYDVATVLKVDLNLRTRPGMLFVQKILKQVACKV